MSGIRKQLQRLLCAFLALGMFAAVSAPTATAQTAQTDLVAQFFDEQELVDVNRAAAYLGMDLQTFAQAAVEVHFFLLAIAGKLDADECLLGYGATIDEHSGNKITWLEYPGELGAKFISILTHYCLTRPQTQRFNLALLTFLVGANASQNGLTLPAVGAPTHGERTNGYDETPAQGWAVYFLDLLVSMTRHDLTTADNSSCVGGGHAGYDEDLLFAYFDSWAHPNHAAPELLAELDLMIFALEDHLAAACRGDLDAQMHNAGVFRFLAFNAVYWQRVHLGFVPTVPALRSHNIGSDFSVWDLINEVNLLFFDGTETGLYVGSCFDEENSYYFLVANDLAQSRTDVLDYLAVADLTAEERLALEDVAALLALVVLRMDELHDSLCRGPEDRDAAIFTVGILAEELYLLGHLSNVGTLD